MPDHRPARKFCAARDPPNNPCSRPAEHLSKWCRSVLFSSATQAYQPSEINHRVCLPIRISTHEEIEGKLLKLYKRHTAALESDIALRKPVFLARSVALKAGITDAMVTLEALRVWYADARHQWVLATRYLYLALALALRTLD